MIASCAADTERSIGMGFIEGYRRVIARPPVRRLPVWRSLLAIASIVGGAFFLLSKPLYGIPLLVFGIVFGLSNIARAPSRQMILLTWRKGVRLPPGLAIEDAARERQRKIDAELVKARRARERGSPPDETLR